MDAQQAGPISFNTIMNDHIEISVDCVITPETFKVIPGRGMPVLNNDPLGPIKLDFQRGNLIVKFDIQFPQCLSEDKKNKLIDILDEGVAY